MNFWAETRTLPVAFWSVCQRCVLALDATMLTGYTLTFCRCDRCGHMTDLTIVRR